MSPMRICWRRSAECCNTEKKVKDCPSHCEAGFSLPRRKAEAGSEAEVKGIIVQIPGSRRHPENVPAEIQQDAPVLRAEGVTAGPEVLRIPSAQEIKGRLCLLDSTRRVMHSIRNQMMAFAASSAPQP